MAFQNNFTYSVPHQPGWGANWSTHGKPPDYQRIEQPWLTSHVVLMVLEL